MLTTAMMLDPGAIVWTDRALTDSSLGRERFDFTNCRAMWHAASRATLVDAGDG